MLNEVLLFVRPEEKVALERVLTCVVGPCYTAMPALGRGAAGGIVYDAQQRSRIRSLFVRPAMAQFLPKTAYCLIVDSDEVDHLLDAVAGALAAEGGPADCGRGVAIVSPVGAQVSVQLAAIGEDAPVRSNGAVTGLRT